MLDKSVGESLDRLMIIDLPRRGVIDTIYPLARRRQGGPLALSAAELLNSRLEPGKLALIATGWLDRPHVSWQVAETDGPPGAAVLARSLHLGTGAVPVLLVEEELIEVMTGVMHASGLRVLSVDEAIAAVSSRAALHACAILPLPRDYARARELAESLTGEYEVGAFIAVEKGGANDRGQIHTSRGANTSDALGKGDAVLEVCTALGIASVGIGDGGNEIGMGSIATDLRPVLRYGADCGCGCGGGTVPAASTDVVVAATVSNWGAYAVAAALAAIRKDQSLLHTPERETALLLACNRAGLIDGVTGRVEATTDGLDLDVHLAFVQLLAAAVGQGVALQGWSAELRRGEQP